jgi:hypothetical protein
MAGCRYTRSNSCMRRRRDVAAHTAAHVHDALRCRAVETVQEHLEALRAYPLVPRPEIFGLHENADITCDQNETYDLFATVLSLQPRVSTGAGVSREDVIQAKCEAIASKLPSEFDVEAVQDTYPTSYEESMNTVLAQECIRCASSRLRMSLLLQAASLTCMQALRTHCYPLWSPLGTCITTEPLVGLVWSVLPV